MAKYMDVHEGMHGITAEGLLAAHQAYLDIQGSEGVDFQHAWPDTESGMVWCVSEAPVVRVLLTAATMAQLAS